MSEEYTPEEQEYEMLVKLYYPDKLDPRVCARMWELEQIIYDDRCRQTLVPDNMRPNRVEITLTDGEIPVLSWDDDFLRRVEAHMEAHPEDGEVRPGGFYREFVRAPRAVANTVGKILGKDGHDGFTVTIKVGARPPQPPPGTAMLY